MRQLVWDYYDKKICSAGCGTELTMENYEMGHIVSKALGGDNKMDNLCILCMPCNRSMLTASVMEYSKSRGYKPIFQPIKVKGRLIYKNKTDLLIDTEVIDRSDVQRLCKYNGLKANRSTIDMINDLADLRDDKVIKKDNYKAGTIINDTNSNSCVKVCLSMGCLILLAVALFIVFKINH